MVLSRRERSVVIGTAIVIAALVLDRFAVEPALDSWTALETEKQNLTGKVERGQSVLKQQPAADATLKRRVAEGLKQNAADTEDTLLHSIREWSQDSQLTLTSVGAERAGRQEQHTPEVIVQIAGAGPMRAVARFLGDIQTARLPVKVVSLELNSRREGADDLSLTLHLSALYLPADWKVPSAGRAAPAPGGSRP